jgi:hypothetical protein
MLDRMLPVNRYFLLEDPPPTPPIRGRGEIIEMRVREHP